MTRVDLPDADEAVGRRYRASLWSIGFLNSGRRLLLFRAGVIRAGDELDGASARRWLRLIRIHGARFIWERIAALDALASKAAA